MLLSPSFLSFHCLLYPSTSWCRKWSNQTRSRHRTTLTWETCSWCSVSTGSTLGVQPLYRYWTLWLSPVEIWKPVITYLMVYFIVYKCTISLTFNLLYHSWWIVTLTCMQRDFLIMEVTKVVSVLGLTASPKIVISLLEQPFTSGHSSWTICILRVYKKASPIPLFQHEVSITCLKHFFILFLVGPARAGGLAFVELNST